MGGKGEAAREGARLAELEGLVRDMEQEKQQLQVNCAVCYDTVCLCHIFS